MWNSKKLSKKMLVLSFSISIIIFITSINLVSYIKFFYLYSYNKLGYSLLNEYSQTDINKLITNTTRYITKIDDDLNKLPNYNRGDIEYIIKLRTFHTFICSIRIILIIYSYIVIKKYRKDKNFKKIFLSTYFSVFILSSFFFIILTSAVSSNEIIKTTLSGWYEIYFGALNYRNQTKYLFSFDFYYYMKDFYLVFYVIISFGFIEIIKNISFLKYYKEYQKAIKINREKQLKKIITRVQNKSKSL